MAFQGDGDASFNSFVQGLLNTAKNNKENARGVLWAHGSDGFPHEGLGYWRKYIHVGLFLHALRFNEPANDWFHLGKEYPGSEFLENTGYPRIYADVQHKDLATLTWADSRQVSSRPPYGPFGNIGTLTLIAYEYKNGFVLDFIDYLIDEVGYRFNDEDWATFLFYDDSNIPSKSYRELPLSHYWPDMEAAIFRSGWDQNAMVFYMKSGSPGGHSRRLKNLAVGGHDHPDANGFVIFYNNDYLAAEDGAFPGLGPAPVPNKITYGHNTFLIDGLGQKGDQTTNIATTSANMDYLDSEHVGYLLGDATDAYSGIDRFYRYVIYKKHKYFIMVDELKDNVTHKYEYLLGTDSNHSIVSTGSNQFIISPLTGTAKLQAIFVEPQEMNSSINQDRPYAIDISMVDMLRVWPKQNTASATFFTLLYPSKDSDPEPVFTKIFDGARSGIVVDGDEYYLYNPPNSTYTYGNVSTDAKLCYFKDNQNAFEYLVARSKEFLFQGNRGINSDKLLVAAFKDKSGTLRLGKNLGATGSAVITLFYPNILGVEIDGQLTSLLDSGPGWIKFALSPKQYKIGPTGFEQTVTDNYEVKILATPALQVSRPNGGETWEVGSSQAIVWATDGTFPTVKLEFSNDDGGSWQIITEGVENSGQFSWLIPNQVSNVCRVRISDALDSVPFDVSDQVFAIIKPPSNPIITSFNPNRGQVQTEVTLTGKNFITVSDVAFNDVSVNSFTVDSDIQIRTLVPVGASTGRIRATSPEGTGISTEDFRVIQPPILTSFNPTSGVVGTEVTIQGSNFIEVGDVSFNGVSASVYTVDSALQIRAKVPAGASSGTLSTLIYKYNHILIT